MPWHVALDQASERRLGKLQIGTTRRGIGPTYADKAARLGIRVQDLLDPKILREKIEVALAEKNLWLERVYGVEPLELEEVASSVASGSRSAFGRTSPTRRCSSTGRSTTGEFVLFEGAQATLLDLDHGTYPFVTSSNPVAADASVGHRDRADADRCGHRRVEGVRHARRRRAVPDGDRGARPGARPRARRRVRHGHRPRAPLRLARPRRAALRGARERDHVARADEARRPLGVRRAAGLRRATGCGTAPRRVDFPAHQSDFHHAEPSTRRCPAGQSRSTRSPPSPSCPRRRARTSSSSSGSSASRSRSSGREPSAKPCCRLAASKSSRGPSRQSNVTTSLAIASSRGVMIMRPASRPSSARHA